MIVFIELVLGILMPWNLQQWPITVGPLLWLVVLVPRLAVDSSLSLVPVHFLVALCLPAIRVWAPVLCVANIHVKVCTTMLMCCSVVLWDYSSPPQHAFQAACCLHSASTLRCMFCAFLFHGLPQIPCYFVGTS
jgi:hypothetical protein